MIYLNRLTFLQNSVYPLSFDTSYKMYWPCMNKHWPFQMVMSKMIWAEWEFKVLTGSATFQNKGTCWKTFFGISFVSFVMFLLLRLLILTWISESELGHIKPQSHYSDNQSPTNDNRRPSTTIDNQLPTKFSIDNRSPTSCRPVANQLPITRRSDGDWISNHHLKFENQSATGYHQINDWLATIRRSVADHSALGEQRLDKFMHTNLKLLLWAW